MCFLRISQIRLEILKSFYEMLGSERQQEFYAETENTSESLPVGSNRLFTAEVEVPQMQNDDLAEADQSQLEIELEEQEGAVGGILEDEVGSTQVGGCVNCKYLILKLDESCNVPLTLYLLCLLFILDCHGQRRGFYY